MGFINSYKQLEKLCNEIYGNNHGISSYIDDMSKLTSDSRYISSWDDDLKQLKRYRWIRNQIVHEPDCTEESMCECEDAKWLDNFYSRIMSGTDPITLHRKIRSSQAAQKPKQTTYADKTRNYPLTQKQRRIEYTEHVYPEHRRTESESTGCLTYFVGGLFFVLVIAVVVITL